MAEEDPVLKVRIVYVLPDESPIEKISREGSEGVTFGNARPGNSGSEAVRQRVIRAQESPLDREMSRYALGGALTDEGRTERARIFAQAASFSQRESWLKGHARYVERWEDRNEARYSRSEDVASFTAFRQGEREEERGENLVRRHVIKGYKRSFRDWNRQQAQEDRNELRYTRNKDRADFQKFREDEAAEEAENAPPSGVQFGPGGGMYAEHNRNMAQERAESGSWIRRNLPTFRKFLGLNDKGGGMSSFYRRFLINEAIRAVGQVAENVVEQPAGILGTGGNGVSMAEFGVSNTRALANSVPFIGSFSFAAADRISGAGYAAAGARLAQGDVQAGVERRALNSERLAIGGSARESSTPRGLQRDYAGIEEDLRKSLEASRDRETKESTINSASADRRRAEISAGLHQVGFIFGVLDDLGFTSAAYSGLDAITQKGRTSAAAHRQTDDANAQIIAAQRRKDLGDDVVLSGSRSTTEGSLALSQADRTIRTMGVGYFDPRVQARQQIQQLGFANETANSQQDLSYEQTRVKSGQAAADAIRPGQIKERQARERQAETQTQAINAQTDRDISNMRIGLNQQGGALKAALARDPSAGIESDYQIGLSRSRQLPVDMQGQGAANAKMQRDLSQSELKDRQMALGGSLALRETVSGIQAQAFGPGADAMRRKAEIVGIAGGAENEAQGYLRDRSLGTDAQRLSFADSARKTGINNLEGYAANYIAGFSSVETGRNNIAAGNKDSSNPSNVFRSIDDGIRALKSNVGNGDITGAKGSLGGDSANNLLQKILDALTNGALLATP